MINKDQVTIMRLKYQLVPQKLIYTIQIHIHKNQHEQGNEHDSCITPHNVTKQIHKQA